MTPPRALRRPPRRAPRLVTAAFAAAAVVVGLLLPTAALAAPAPTPTPTPTSSLAPGTTAFALSPLGNGVVRPGSVLAVTVSLQNGTDAELPATTVTLSLGRTPLADRARLTAWLDGTGETPALEPVTTGVLEAVDPGSFQVRGLTVAADDPALAGLGAGVYPLAASYQDATGTVVTSTSALIVPRADDAAVGIGVVVPITAGPLGEGLLTADELAELTAADGELTEQLDAVTGTLAILAVDPAIPAAIRVLGSSAPESAVDWLTRLDALQNSRFALQFGDADVTAQMEAGFPRPLAPTSLTAYMDASDFSAPTPGPTASPTGTPTPTPTATPTPGSVFPSTDELLAVGPATRSAVYWPADGTATTEVVGSLGDLSTDDVAATTIVPSDTTRTGAGGGTVSAHGRVGDADVLVYDSDVSSALDDASGTEESWLRGAPLTAATAYLAFATAETGDALLVTVGRGDDRTRLGLGAAISAALTAPGVEPRTLPALAAGDPVAVELTDVAPSSGRADAASVLVGEESEIGRFATILDDPALLTGPERAEILQVLGVAWVGDDGWPAALADHRAQTADTLTSVALLPTSPSDLYGSRAGLQFWVRNDLPYPVNLVLYATRDNLRIDVQSETPVVATPESNTRVEVPVQARVGRGEVTLTLQLRSPAFVAIGDPETVEVNVWADWEGVGIAALAVLVGALLVIGVARTVLRVRRRGKKADAAEPAGAEEPDGDADAESAVEEQDTATAEAEPEEPGGDAVAAETDEHGSEPEETGK